jgi:transposase-like protein
MDIIKNKSCELCGSEHIEHCEAPHTAPVPYSSNGATYVQKTIVCYDCGAEIDDTDDEDIKKAYDIANQGAIQEILKFFTDQGHSLASIERALGLPQRTISRWKGKSDLSSVGLALLRVIRTFPWILDVAEKKYERGHAAEIMIVNAVQTMRKKGLLNGVRASGGRYAN